MLKQPNFFCSQPSTILKKVLAKFHLSTTFGLNFVSFLTLPNCCPLMHI